MVFFSFERVPVVLRAKFRNQRMSANRIAAKCTVVRDDMIVFDLLTDSPHAKPWCARNNSRFIYKKGGVTMICSISNLAGQYGSKKQHGP